VVEVGRENCILAAIIGEEVEEEMLAASLVFLIIVIVAVSVNAATDDGPTCACTMQHACSIKGNALLGGVDFVQYFTDFKLPDGTYNESATGRIGNSNIYSNVGSYTTYFLSEEHKALFDASPEAYLPQWGGYCSWGVAAEHCPQFPWTQDCLGPPGVWNQWTIVDEKLYFFFEEDPKNWFKTQPNATYNVDMGNARWAKWFPDNPIANMNTECYHPRGPGPRPGPGHGYGRHGPPAGTAN
jgi:YHS domain-containing protein